MAQYGTTQKCNTCDKIVHFVEMMSADGVPYHKNCFKCCHCNGHLAMSNYSAVDGKLYCKTHHEQLFKETGSHTVQSFGKPVELNKAPSKVSTHFCGTQEKCAVCTKTVYPLEKVTVEEKFYHKPCFRCAHGGCNITPSSYAALDGILYCKPHFAQLFKEKGSYTHLTQTTNSKKNALAHDAASAPTSDSEQPDENPTDELKEHDEDDK
ncbi:hypothetical protein CASFOL_008146 [Castilleja foliolosa]|uniref:LIM zinc-binding domain-containing protein n=1 Tax=Castilleja foliolosa TaxID=1961234 RepID=A0ABD3DYF6_9LAMI